MSMSYLEKDIYNITKLMENLFDMKSQSLKYSYKMKQVDCINDACEKKERKRRVTPIPIDVVKEKKDVTLLRRKKLSKTYLSVEEEDADDLENYQQESDYVSPDMVGKIEFIKRNRSSWHGETFKTELSRKQRRTIGLTKTKSVDRGIDYKRRTRKISVVDSNLPKIIDMTEKLEIVNEKSPAEENCELPLWMQNAKNETTQNQRNPKPEKKNSILQRLSDIEAKQLKEKQMFSNRRRELLRQKTMEEKRKHRKITPSKLHSSFSFDKFRELRNCAKKYQVTEEEEE